MIFYLQKIEMLGELNFIYDGLAKLNLNAPLDDDKAWRENLEVSQKYSYLPFDGASAISVSTHEAAPSMIGAETVTGPEELAEKLNLNPALEASVVFVFGVGTDFL